VSVLKTKIRIVSVYAVAILVLISTSNFSEAQLLHPCY
jgi:hypothetical protein